MTRMAAELRVLQDRSKTLLLANEDVPAGAEADADAEAEADITAVDGEAVGEVVGEEAGEQPSVATSAPAAATSRLPTTEEERARLEALRMESRLMRHELSKWRHQADSLEAERTGQEREIVYLKAQLAHARDVLDSTRHAVKHHEVERKLREVSLLPLPVDTSGASDIRDLRLLQGGDLSKLMLNTNKGAIEAKAERAIRERTEERAGSLSIKAQRLMGVVSSQQLLIQRLEKQLIKDEDALEQREWQLADAAKQRKRLKGALRQRSDDLVAAAVGVPGMRKKLSSSVPPGRCSDSGSGGMVKSSSVSQLPSIDDKN
uniref:Uncharacterized protein n=1 Tax=Alexandrium andersonii TaxID=327968 RepID=A0A7S2G794_9DINO|mmetsp:Transcript_42027/g.95410  ORF Transcript_42027/g.95410 Transcript_42027/m.95410 type:complete len:318 (+) Transcript_42027:3-956(+)